MPIDIWTSLLYKHWMDDFHWPINVKELFKIRVKLEQSLFKCLENVKDYYYQQNLKIIFNWLVIEYLTIYESLYVLKYFNDLGVLPDAQDQHPLWGLSKGLINNGIPGTTILSLDGYERNFKRELKNSIRTIKSFLNSFFSGINNNKCYTLCYPIELTFTTVEFEKAFCKNLNFAKLFSKKILNKSSDNEDTLSDFSKLISLSICELYKKNGLENLPNKVENYIFDLSKKYIVKTALYLDWIRKKRSIPENLLAGSGHKYYTRLIGSLVREKGGDLTCVEHGDPNALYKFSFQGYGEFGICNKYITYTKHCAELYKKSWNKSLNLQENMPEMIISPIGNELYNSIYKKHKKNKISSNKKKILYVAGGFRNDYPFLETRLPDLVYLEWQHYLLRTLKSLGYEVICKYHPESILQGKRFEPIQDVGYAYGRFEDFIENGDIFLFDHPMSTAFISALCSARPVVLISNEINEIQDEALEYLSSRCQIVKGYHDQNNRFRVDKEELNTALLISDKNKNYDFVERYIGIFN